MLQVTRFRPGRLLAGMLSTTLPAGIQDFDFQFPEKVPRLLIISNDCGVRRIITSEGGGTSWPASVTFDALLLDRFRSDESGFLGQEIFRERAQRSDVVDDPYPAAVSGEDEIVRPRLDRQVAHRHGRETAAFVLRPGYATIDRNIETKLSPEKEQIRLDQVFLDDVSIAANCRGRGLPAVLLLVGRTAASG